MKKLIIISSITSMLIANQQTDKAVSDFVQKVEPTSQILIYSKKDDILGGIYHIRTTKSEFAVSQDFKTLFPTKNSILIESNEKFEQSYIPYDLKQHQPKSIFKLGQGEKNIYIFFNPTCPISNDFFIKIYNNKEFKNKYTMLFYLFIPTDKNGEHPFLSEALSNHILNAANPAEKYYEIAHIPTNPKFNYLNIAGQERELYAAKIKESNNLAKTVGAVATPNMFEDDAKPYYLQREIKNLEKGD